MKSRCFIPGLLATTLIFALNPAIAQPSPGMTSVAPAGQRISQQELDQLLAPIALYPDPLLAQIFMASTYPLEVVQAARWVKSNPKVTGKALEEAMTRQSWDPAVKSMTAVPQVLQQMNEKLDWTQKLGDAFLAQQQDVMNTVQSLRAKAYATGNLKSSDQLVVKTEAQGTQVIYVVQPAKTEVVYVPIYNPSVVYGTWWYSYPPYYMYPPAYMYPPGVAFATGVVVGAAIWGNCNWGHGHSSVNVNISHYNSFNRTSISHTSVSATSWTHNAEHRRGVAYSNQAVAQQYSRNATTKGNLRGDAELEGAPSKNAANRRGQNANHASPEALKDNFDDRDLNTASNELIGSTRASNVQPGDRVPESSDSGFSGLGNSASTRELGQPDNANRTDRGNYGGSVRGGRDGLSSSSGPRGGNRR